MINRWIYVVALFILVCLLSACDDFSSGDSDDATTDGDLTDGDATDGDTTDGDMTDGDTTDGDTIDGDTTDGDTADGDVTDGDTTDGDITDGDNDSMTVGPEGGTVITPDGAVSLEVPAGAVAEETTITVEMVNPADLPDLGEEIPVVAAWRFGPEGLTFNEPVVLTVVSDGYLPTDGFVDIAAEALVYWSEDGLEQLSDNTHAVSLVDGISQVTAKLTHFSVIAEVHDGNTVRMVPPPRQYEVGEHLKFYASVRVFTTEPFWYELQYKAHSSEALKLDGSDEFDDLHFDAMVNPDYPFEVRHSMYCAEEGMGFLEIMPFMRCTGPTGILNSINSSLYVTTETRCYIDPPSCQFNHECDDSNVCTQDTCQEDGTCNNSPVADGTACDDYNPETEASECRTGECVGTETPIDGDEDTDTEDAADGDEEGEPGCRSDEACDDGNPCTIDHCEQDVCIHEEDPCTNEHFLNPCYLYTCQPETGDCIRTGTVQCEQDDNPCTNNVCKDETGECDVIYVEDDTACDDGIPETQYSVCRGGACVGSVEVWIDPDTSYKWEKSPSTSKYNWQDAIDYCLSLGEYWRMPNIDDLRSIVDQCPAVETGGSCGLTASCPVMDCRDSSCGGCNGIPGCLWKSGLGGLCGTAYWSSTENPDATTIVWTIHYLNAQISGGSKSAINHVRCVKDF